MALTQVPIELSSTPGIVDNSNDTAITIDSSENVLVGKTSASTNTVGVEARADGTFAAVKSSGGAVVLGRNTDDGTIVTFRKDGLPVGLISTVAGRLGIGTGDAGLFFDDDNNRIGPVTLATGTPVDSNGLLDLGYSGARFKDLYLGNDIAHLDAAGNARLLYDRSSNLLGNAGTNLSGASLLVGTSSVLSLGQVSMVFDGTTQNGYIAKTTRSATGSNFAVFLNSSGSVAGTITHNGSTTVNYGTSSDERLKENIADADDAGSKVDAIQVRKFDWIADGSHQDYGMIAQELQTVAPEAVSAPEDPEEMMGVDYSKLVPMLVKEIQSLRARVAQLENN